MARDLFLGPDSRLSTDRPLQDGSRVSRVDDDERMHFDYRFDRTTEIIGYPTLTVWFQTDASDADLYVYLTKIDVNGREMLHQKLTLGLPGARRWMPLARRWVSALNAAFFFGAEGRIRASAREILDQPPGEEIALAGTVGAPLPDGPVELTVPI